MNVQRKPFHYSSSLAGQSVHLIVMWPSLTAPRWRGSVSAMPIKFECPECSNELTVADDLAGRKGKCFHCGAAAVVPQPEPAYEYGPHYFPLMLAMLLRVAGVVSAFTAIAVAFVGSVEHGAWLPMCGASLVSSLGFFWMSAVIGLLVELVERK